MTEVEVKLKIKLSDQEIDSILSAAFEGGINYWAVKVDPKDGDFKGTKYASEALSKGATLIIRTDDDGNLELDKDKFVSGLEKAIVKYPHLFRMNAETLDIGYIDAEVADVIIQMAVFGEVVYG